MVKVSIGCRDLTIFGRRGGGTDDGGLTLDCGSAAAGRFLASSREMRYLIMAGTGSERKGRGRVGLVVLIRPP